MSKIQQVYPELISWESFVEEYNYSHNEYTFIYKDFYIRLDYNRDGTRFIIYRVRKQEYDKSILWRIFHKMEMFDYQEFLTPRELAENAMIDGKPLKDIWDELE